MNENRNIPSGGTDSTRKVPTGRNTTSRPAPSTRQVPAAKRSAPASSGDTGAQQAPSVRSVPSANTGAARQVPAVRNMPDPSGDAGVTRQVPVARTAPATSKDARTARQIPVARASSAPSGDAGATRQIPVARTAPATPNDAGATRQIPISNTSASAEDSTSNGSNGDVAATRPISTADIASEGNAAAASVSSSSTTSAKKIVSETDTSSESKKKKSRDGSSVASIIKAVIYIVAVLVVSIGASIAIILVGNDMYAFVKSDTPVEIVVPENADINDIADLLSANGIINYPSLFKWYAADHNDDGKFVAGTYTVSPATDYEDLLAMFKEQIPEGTTWVTIPEGFTTDEIIDLMVSKGIGTKEGYIDAINNYPYDYWFVQELDAKNWKSTGRIYRLDGYLFPDTYEFYNRSSEKTVIGRLLARFNMIYGEKYKEDAEKTGLTTDELIIVASMIEKEAGDASDYYLVSSVFHNRLKNPNYPALESDATVLYAIHHDKGERPNTVTPEDLELDTPYNTYKYHGLPPGPIANPSASAINAALAPENTGYYFFVSYGRETYFSSTKEEHDYYIAMIKDMMAAANNNNQG